MFSLYSYKIPVFALSNFKLNAIMDRNSVALCCTEEEKAWIL